MSGLIGRAAAERAAKLHAAAGLAETEPAAAESVAHEGSANNADALQVLRGYPEPEEVAALVAVLTAIAQAGAATPAAVPPARAPRAPAGAFVHRYQSPTSWQTP